MNRISAKAVLAFAMIALSAGVAHATPFFFSTGSPDGRIGTGSRPAGAAGLEIESADDFILSQATSITGATFNGLLPLGASISAVRLEIYRVFPNDSTNPPSGRVPTRDNSPSDVAFQERDGAALSYSTMDLGAFGVANTALKGINPKPSQTTGGEGPANGQQVLFNVTLATPFDLPADHYFFIPQVQLDQGDFLWLSAPTPIPAGTGPFAPDLESWIRNENLAPDWLRIGTDVVGAQNGGVPYNAAFSLSGQTQGQAVPEPPLWTLLGAGLFALLAVRRRGGRAG